MIRPLALVPKISALTKPIWKNACLKSWKKTYRPEFINRIDEKVVFHSLSSEDMQQVVKVMVKPLIATLAEQGMTPQIPAFSAHVASNQRLRSRNGSSPTASCLADRSGRSTSRAIAERPSSKKDKRSRLERQPERSSLRLSRGCHDASAINPYFRFWRPLCRSTSGFCPFPKCPTYFCHLFFSWWYLKGIAFAFLVMMITMFVSAFFPGDEPDCVSFRLSPLAVWCSFGASVTSGCLCPSDPFLWAYCPLLMGSWSIVFMPWYTIFLGGPMLWSMVLVLTLPMLCRRSFSIPLSIKSLGDFMLKKPFLAWWPICSSSFSELRSVS